jgi:hypothetical protein
MNQITTWAWTVVNGVMHASGTVQAVDARDAVVRALTSASSEGTLFVGTLFKLPATVIDGFPMNGTLFHEVQHEGTYLAVRESTYRADDQRTLLELKALWKLLADIPVACSSDNDAADSEGSSHFDDDAIEVPYLHFPAGTPREDIWHWFEAQNKRFIAGDVLKGIWPQ